MQLAALQKQVIEDNARAPLAEAFFNLCAHWNLTRQEEAGLLGWDYGEKRGKLDAMRKDHSPLDNDADKIGRVIDLINIHKSLRILFPNDREAVYSWIKIPRERFGNHSALDIMLQEGKLGITAIRHYLDFERTR